MNLEDVSKQLETIHKENREDHKTMFEKMESAETQIVENAKELLKRPTYREAKQIAKDQNGFKHWLASAIGSIIGAASAFVAMLFFWGKK